jgi:SAM-dependent methyltransferase
VPSRLSKVDALRNLKVRATLQRRLPRGASVLEISCGRGELLAELRGDGFEVRGTNFTAYPDAPPEVPIDIGIDVLAGMPYGDDRFDAVIILDVMEHLSDHHRAVGELSRVLKPGGLLIVATPNIMNLASRLHFLFTGFFKTKRSFVGFDLPAEKAFAFHNYPLHLPVFLYQLHSRGLASVELDAVHYKLKSVLFWLLLAPWVVPLTWHKIHVLEKYLKRTDTGRMMVRRLVSWPALCGETWILTAEKGTQVPRAEARTEMPAWYGEAAGSEPRKG